MDDFKIADSESIKKINEEFKKLNINGKITSLATLSESTKKYLISIFYHLEKEKQLVCYFCDKMQNNNALFECKNLLKEMYLIKDELIKKFELTENNTVKTEGFCIKEVFQQNFDILKNINELLRQNNNLIIKKSLTDIKLKQTEIILILLPFLI